MPMTVEVKRKVIVLVGYAVTSNLKAKVIIASLV
jgi:hypothetical protein